MESLAMKENHLRVTYGGTFVIVLTARKKNGEVETKFLAAPPEKKDVTVFPTQIAMLQPVSYVGEEGP